MARSAPGRHYRKGITLIDAVRRFDTEEKAEAWFVEQRWPDGAVCPFCESRDVQKRPNRKPQPYRCRACRKDFSVTVGTLLHRSHIPLSKWAIALYLYATSLKSVSSMKLHRDLGITQRSAWFMAHRIRRMWSGDEKFVFAGAVEADETYVGGLEKNKREDRKLNCGRGAVGKTAVAGVRDRATGLVIAEVVESTDKKTLQDFVTRHTTADAMVYTDEAAAYRGLPRAHEAVKHGAGEYVRGMAHTNGLESHWALFDRAVAGTFHHVSAKHLSRYAAESEGRHNMRPLDTGEQMTLTAGGAGGKRLTYAGLTDGPYSAAR